MEDIHEQSLGSRVIETPKATSAKEDFQQPVENTKQQKYITELFDKNATSPIAVSAVLVNDSDSIRPAILQQYMEATILRTTNFKQLFEQADVLNLKLMQHGMVENVTQSLDSRGTLKVPLITEHYRSLIYDSHPIPRDLSVIDIVSRLNIVPIKRFTAKTGTNIGNGEGDGYLQFQLRNIFGGGEQLKLDVTKGTKKHSSYLLNYTQPITPWWIWDSSLSKNSRKTGNNDSTELLVRGFRMNLRSGFYGAAALNHEFFYETEWRSSKVTSLNASDSLLFQAGDDLKSSLGHTMVVDRRNDPVAPSRGTFFKVANELALGKFWKSQLELSQNKSWFKDDFLGMCCTLKSGYILNFDPLSAPINICDKFQSGGANDIRSFQVMGLGPKDLYDSIGGDAFVAYGLSIFCRLPVKKWSHSNFRLHWFLNGGKLINHNNGSIFNLANQLSSQHSASAGFGIVLRHPVARFELNFTLPLVCHSGDAIRKGFQYGIGVSFL